MTPAGRWWTRFAGRSHAVTGLTPVLSTSGGTSDGRFLASIAREVIEFGPLNDTIHKIDERVAISDIGPLSAIYEAVARQLLGGLESSRQARHE